MQPYVFYGHSFIALVFALNVEQAMEKFKKEYPKHAIYVFNVELAPENARFFIDEIDYIH